MYQLNFASGSVSNASPLPVAVSTVPVTSVQPGDAQRDPVGKFKVSQPTTLLDTDFEYGPQDLKWESLNLVQNRPSFFGKSTPAVTFTLTALSGGNQAPYSVITGTTSAAHGFSPGDAIAIRGATVTAANGVFILQTASGTSFTYQAKAQINGSVFVDGVQTAVFPGGVWPNAALAVTSITGDGASPSVITVTTTAAHGLMPGTQVVLNNYTTTAVNGRWVITRVASPTTFTFTCATNTVTTVTVGSGLFYVSPDAHFIHRPGDGAIMLNMGNNFIGGEAIRQSRRTFRYQSGKGVVFSTGIKFTPALDVTSITGSGTTATVTTDVNHGLQVGCQFRVENTNVLTGTNTYNGTFTVASVTGLTTFTYTMTSTPSDTAPTGANIYVTPTSWFGSIVRDGIYDERDGMYFEYDGQALYVARRESTKQLSGRIAVSAAANTLTGTNTKFRSQLVAGDNIVIRGMNYEIIQIASDTSLVMSPPYRGGVSLTSEVVYKTQVTKIPQSQWNLDKCDGTGSSAYTIDITKMQMIFIDYSWYGAGTIRWGVRATNGYIVYVHQMPMNNVNNKAFMRSGNLPARFEVASYGQYTRLVAGISGVKGAALSSTDTTMYVESVTGFPSAGYVFLNDGTNCEMVQYTGIGAFNATAGGYPISGLSRRATYTIAGVNAAGSFSSTAYSITGTTSTVTFTPDASVGGSGTAQVAVIATQNTCAPMIVHWGASAILDGGYQTDRALQYTASMLRYANVAAANLSPLLAIRLAPTADSGISGNIGVRSVLNRMQLNFQNMSTLAQGQFLVEGYLNPLTITGNTFPTDWNAFQPSSLSQIVYFGGTNTLGAPVNATANILGGDRVFAYFTENGGGTNFNSTTFDLSNIKDLGTSVLSGDGTSAAPCFPNGPDVLVICARNIATTGAANIAVRLTWTEAQA
jgi:hypothetical protein